MGKLICLQWTVAWLSDEVDLINHEVSTAPGRINLFSLSLVFCKAMNPTKRTMPEIPNCLYFSALHWKKWSHFFLNKRYLNGGHLVDMKMAPLWSHLGSTFFFQCNSRSAVRGQSDGRTDGSYQVHYLPHFAVNKNLQSIHYPGIEKNWLYGTKTVAP